jgi:hypothetical protein
MVLVLYILNMVHTEYGSSEGSECQVHSPILMLLAFVHTEYGTY